MHRRTLIALLAFGTIAGYASGFASLHRYRHGGYCRHDRRPPAAAREASRLPCACPSSQAPAAPDGPGPR
jgi:hypothetical protein